MNVSTRINVLESCSNEEQQVQPNATNSTRNVHSDCKSHWGLNNDYDFLYLFKITSYIMSNDNSLNSIIDLLQTIISDNDIRQMLVLGIKQKFEKSNNFHIINRIYNVLCFNQHHKQQSIPKPKPNSAIAATIKTSKALMIENTVCSMFSYLDLKSLLKCSKVNKQWLYASYRPISLTHVETNQLHKSRRHGANSYSPGHNIFYNILRFKHVPSLKICNWNWNGDLNQYFKNLVEFKNISKLECVFKDLKVTSSNCKSINSTVMDDYIPIANQTIQSNKDKLTDVTFRVMFGRGYWSDLFLRNSIFESLFLPNLQKLHIYGLVMKGFYLNKDNSLSTENKNKNKLQHLFFENCHLELGFWKDLANDKSDLSNLTALSFVGCSITEHHKKQIESKYLLQIAAKLVNMTFLQCMAACGTLASHPIEIKVESILPSFLSCLSNNKRSRSSLNILRIDIDDDWFTNVNYKNNTNIYTNGFNFYNLQQAVICLARSVYNNMPGEKKLQIVLSIIGCKKRPSNNDCDSSSSFTVSKNLQCNQSKPICALKLDWISNVKLLELFRIDLVHVRPRVFLSCLNEIKFTSLRRLHVQASKIGEYDFNRKKKYCTFQKVPMTSITELCHVMQMLNKNSEHSIDIKLTSKIHSYYLHVSITAAHSLQHQNKIDSILDILSQWFLGYKNVLLMFVIRDLNGVSADYKFPTHFAACLFHKIDQIDDKKHHIYVNKNVAVNETVEETIRKARFVGPHYGGNTDHFCNIMVRNNRVCVGVHKHRNSPHQFQLAVQITHHVHQISKTGSDLFECSHNVCKYR